MNELVFDTDVLIDHLRGVEKATALVERVKSGDVVGYISTLTEAELFAGKDSAESDKRALLSELLSLFTKINIDEFIARTGGEFRRKYGIELADALIAATASTARCKLLTGNLKDFKKVKEISAEEPY